MGNTCEGKWRVIEIQKYHARARRVLAEESALTRCCLGTERHRVDPVTCEGEMLSSQRLSGRGFHLRISERRLCSPSGYFSGASKGGEKP